MVVGPILFFLAIEQGEFPKWELRVQIASDHDKLSGLNAETEVVRVIDLGDGRQSLGLTILSMS